MVNVHVYNIVVDTIGVNTQEANNCEAIILLPVSTEKVSFTTEQEETLNVLAKMLLPVIVENVSFPTTIDEAVSELIRIVFPVNVLHVSLCVCKKLVKMDPVEMVLPVRVRKVSVPTAIEEADKVHTFSVIPEMDPLSMVKEDANREETLMLLTVFDEIIKVDG